MKSAFRTTEFWAALITNVMGWVVLFGGLTAEEGAAVSGELKTVAGCVLAILSALGYIGTRTAVKASRAKALAAGIPVKEVRDAGL
jgi:hypothetical protein